MFHPQPINYSDYYSQPPYSSNNCIYYSIPGPQQHGQYQQQFRRAPTGFDSGTPHYSAAPPGLWGPVGGQTQQQQQLPLRPVHRHLQPQYYDPREITHKMEVGDYEAQQALAGGYAPKLEGPLVGEKRSSHAITEEYAKADPVYVEKTRRLPQTYSYYRPVLGDGSCGWRAIGFSYFECLIKLWSLEKVQVEQARLASLNETISALGIMDSYMVADFWEPTEQLLSNLASMIASNASENIATEAVKSDFNDEGSGSYILYYFRCITALHLLTNSMAYEPFLEQGMTIDAEKNTMLAVSSEIDGLGLTVLIDALMKPANFAVEIVVLERSQGSEANTHCYNLDVNGNQMSNNTPTAYLLYRPGHYDILYKGDENHALQQQQILSAANAARNIHVNRAAVQTRNMEPSRMSSMGYGGDVDIGLFSDIPGGSMSSSFDMQQGYTPMSSSYAPTPSSYAPSPTSYAPSPYGVDPTRSMSMQSAPIKAMSPSPMTVSSTLASIPPRPTRASRTPPSNFPPQHFSGSALPSQSATRNNSTATDSSLMSPPVMTPTTPQILHQLSSLGVNSNDPFRQSRYVFERPTDRRSPSAAWGGGGAGGKDGFEMQTRQFRESHHNEAHYDNKNFQPYMWSPWEEGEEEGGRKGGKAGKRRGS